MTAYYNEIDPFAAQWLRNLIKAGHIAPGVVDERSIEEVKSDEIKEFTQCHFFAGIGVWSHALRRAGWPDDARVWTGSCPCQPFSTAGKRKGTSDDRHLWPIWFDLVSECKPPVIFGEQVASNEITGKADGSGENVWFDIVSADLESAHYTTAAFDLPASGFGAPHIRQRLWFVADSGDERFQIKQSERGVSRKKNASSSASCRMGDASEQPGERDTGSIQGQKTTSSGKGNQNGRLGNGYSNAGDDDRGFWSDIDWYEFKDGKARCVESGTFPLADGATQRVGRLRAYGNAICAPVASEFIAAYMDSIT